MVSSQHSHNPDLGPRAAIPDIVPGGWSKALVYARAIVRRMSDTSELVGQADAAPPPIDVDAELSRRLVVAARQLTDADRGTYFEIDWPNRELCSRVAEGAEHDAIRLRIELGIVGWVATHGKTANVVDAYQDPRFERSIDEHTGYRTTSVLCAPVWGRRDEVVGVLQVLNKRATGAFTDDDEALLRSFGSVVGVAVQLSRRYHATGTVPPPTEPMPAAAELRGGRVHNPRRRQKR